MRQMLVDSMLGYSFDGTVTVNCPILVMENENYKKKYQRLQAVSS